MFIKRKNFLKIVEENSRLKTEMLALRLELLRTREDRRILRRHLERCLRS